MLRLAGSGCLLTYTGRIRVCWVIIDYLDDWKKACSQRVDAILYTEVLESCSGLIDV